MSDLKKKKEVIYDSFFLLKWLTVERSCVGGSSTVASIPKFIDIDSDVKDPLLCSLYAPDIHYNLRVSEVLIPLEF